MLEGVSGCGCAKLLWWLLLCTCGLISGCLSLWFGFISFFVACTLACAGYLVFDCSCGTCGFGVLWIELTCLDALLTVPLCLWVCWGLNGVMIC